MKALFFLGAAALAFKQMNHGLKEAEKKEKAKRKAKKLRK